MITYLIVITNLYRMYNVSITWLILYTTYCILRVLQFYICHYLVNMTQTKGVKCKFSLKTVYYHYYVKILDRTIKMYFKT